MTTSSLGDINPTPGLVLVDPTDPTSGIPDPSLGMTGKLHGSSLEDRLDNINKKRIATGIGPMQSNAKEISSAEYPVMPNDSHGFPHISVQDGKQQQFQMPLSERPNK